MQLDLSKMLDYDNMTVKDLDIFNDIINFVKFGFLSTDKYVYSEQYIESKNNEEYLNGKDIYEVETDSSYNIKFAEDSMAGSRYTRWAA